MIGTRAVICLWVLGTAGAPCAAQQPYFFGMNGALGSLTAPYGGSCAGDRGASASLGLYAGHVAGPLEFTGSYTHVINVAERAAMCTLEARVLPDGDHVIRRYHRGDNSVMNLLDMRVGYSPASIRNVAVHVGVGVETRDWDPMVLVGASFRTNGSVRLRIGADLAYLRGNYDNVMETWASGLPTATAVVDEGGAWQRHAYVRIGIEVGLPQPARRRLR